MTLCRQLFVWYLGGSPQSLAYFLGLGTLSPSPGIPHPQHLCAVPPCLPIPPTPLRRCPPLPGLRASDVLLKGTAQFRQSLEESPWLVSTPSPETPAQTATEQVKGRANRKKGALSH